MLEVQRLYPQYKTISDRRKESVPVSFERRSGVDRRTQDRVQLDTNLTKDIFEVKSKIAQVQNPNTDNVTKVAENKSIEKAAVSTPNSDSFVKTQKASAPDLSKYEPSKESKAAAGMLIGVLGGALGAACLGPVAGGVAFCVGVYAGIKLLKNEVIAHLKDTDQTKKN